MEEYEVIIWRGPYSSSTRYFVSADIAHQYYDNLMKYDWDVTHMRLRSPAGRLLRLYGGFE
jgi:hypothetical protein